MKCKNCQFWKHRGDAVKLKMSGKTLVPDSYGPPGRPFSYNQHQWADEPRNIGGTITNIEVEETIQQPFGDCSNPKLIYTGAGGCVEDEIYNPEDSLIHSDSEAYGAYLMTGREFGCVHFQEKK